MVINTLLMGKPGSHPVETASVLLKNLYWLERETMRILAGHLFVVADFTVKYELPKHIWQDSLRADKLRSRVMEMRFPRRDVDQKPEAPFGRLVNLLSLAANEHELIEGVYRLTKSMIAEAYDAYIALADTLDDAPTLMLIGTFAFEIREQIKASFILTQQLGKLGTIDPQWKQGVEEALAECRKMLGISALFSSDATIEVERPQLLLPMVPARGPEFGLAKYFYPIHDWGDSLMEKQIMAALSHANELWAAEITAKVMWEWDDMPWEFYMDCARWSYDEIRHSHMGIRRLAEWGLKVGEDYCIFPEPFVCLHDQSTFAIFALLHRMELNAPGAKSVMKAYFEEEGDTATSQSIDYDWADESIHLLYGHKWSLHRLGGDMDELDEWKENMHDLYWQRRRELLMTWDYEPYRGRIMQRLEHLRANGLQSGEAADHA